MIVARRSAAAAAGDRRRRRDPVHQPVLCDKPQGRAAKSTLLDGDHRRDRRPARQCRLHRPHHHHVRTSAAVPANRYTSCMATTASRFVLKPHRTHSIDAAYS